MAFSFSEDRLIFSSLAINPFSIFFLDSPLPLPLVTSGILHGGVKLIMPQPMDCLRATECQIMEQLARTWRTPSPVVIAVAGRQQEISSQHTTYTMLAAQAALIPRQRQLVSRSVRYFWSL